jgi:hypothetical protein
VRHGQQRLAKAPLTRRFPQRASMGWRALTGQGRGFGGAPPPRGGREGRSSTDIGGVSARTVSRVADFGSSENLLT